MRARHPAARLQDGQALGAARQRAGQELSAGVGSPSPDAALAAWSIAHGFATLWNSGAHPEAPGSADDASRAVLRHLTN